MKKRFHFLLITMLVFALMGGLAACGQQDSQSAAQPDAAAVSDNTAAGLSNSETSPSPDKADDTGSADPAAEPDVAAPDGQPAPTDTAPEPSPTDAAPEKPAPAQEAPATAAENTSTASAEPAPAPAPAQEAPAPAPAEPAPAAAPVDSTPAEEPSGVSLTDIRSKIVSDLGISDYMDVGASRLLDLYGIQEADIAQSASFATMSGVFPGEVIMVEAVNADAAARIKSLLQNRLNEVLNQYKTYDAETYALAEACTVDTDGNFVSMLLSPDRAKMRQILTDSLG